ncbi:MAG: SH3 domain-containing protein [Rikenellaceae bacterium]
MAKYFIKTSQGRFDEVIPGKILGSPGGQGAVYRISSPNNHTKNCIKVYHDHTKFEYDRIDFMLKNPPQINSQDSASFKICWPLDIVYNEHKKAVGYIMPLAFDGSRDLKILEGYTKNKTVADKFKNDVEWHGKFERHNISGISNRLKMMHNWALAVFRVHEVGCYVLVDLKPENVLATPEGKISIVDTDSFQITDSNGRILFKGPVATPPYFPIYGYNLKKLDRPMARACDRFAIAIVFYQILIGVHPYVGTNNRAHKKDVGYSKYFDECSQIEECIQARLFAFGDNKQHFSLVPNSGHENFQNLPQQIKDLFVLTFNGDGSKSPSLIKWLEAFRATITSIDQGKSSIKPIAKPKPKVNIRPIQINHNPASQPQSRPISSQPTYGSTPVTSGNSTTNTTTASKNEPWQDKAVMWILGIWVAYVLYIFFADGFWSAIWVGIKSGILGVIVIFSVFATKKFSRWLISIVVVAVIIATFALRGCGGSDDKKLEEKTPTTVVVKTTTYHSISESGLNIRAAANGSARVIGTLLYNQEVEVIKITNGFAEIKYGAGVGYVSSKYIEKGQSKRETSKPVTTTKPQTTQKPATQTSSKPVTTTQPQQSTTTTQSQPKQNSTTAQTAPKATTATQPAPTKAKTAVDYYNEGMNLAKNFKEAEAKVSLQKAVDMGSLDAMQYLGMMYVNGGEATTGFPLVLKAANAGHKEATFQVAELYNAGTGTAKDKAQAKVWYQKAEAMGDARATSRLRKL